MINGYETKELVEAHVAALERELEQAIAVGDKAGEKAAREQLEVFGRAQKKAKPVERRKRRSAPKPKPKPAAKAAAKPSSSTSSSSSPSK